MIDPRTFPDPETDIPADPSGAEQVAVLAGGCFWCTEAVFKALDGVTAVTSGYAGDSANNADYRSVCSGLTDHAEAIEIRFDPSRVTFGELLKVFFSIAHDPTQLDRQGPDTGRQYRSTIFYREEEQRRVAEAYIDQLERSGIFESPIVTTLEPLDRFFPAEDDHQDYVARNPWQPYVAFNAAPKVEKLRKSFPERLASDDD